MLHRSAVVLVLVVLVLLGIVSSVIGGDLGREESLRILVVETAPQDKDSAEIVRLAGESVALETDLLRMGYEPFQVNTVRIQGNWAFLNLLSFPSKPAPHPDGVFPDILLALAQKDAGGTWHIYLETSEVYHQRLFELPDSLLSPESKNLLASAPVRGQSESRSSDLVPGLPWVVNGSWRYNQSPHGEDESALDFGTPTPGVAAEVRAADTGMVLYAYETRVSVKRRDGLRVGYQHIRPSDVARFTPGEMVHLGDSVGMTTVADGCGGTSTGHHVHFWLETDAGPLNLQGVAMNDWVVTGQQLIRGTEIANPNHADLLLHAPSIADEFDFPVGPPNGTGYGHYSNNGYDVQNTRLPDENSECFGVNWRELWHAGEDWFELGNTAGMAGDPVFAVADGKVQYISPPTYDYRPGAVIILAHRLPDNSITYSMYGHLDPNEIKVYELQEVVRGQQIGRVYDQGWNSHLHWEVRSFEDGSNLCPILPGSGVPGPGYSYPDHPGTIGYYNPSAYVLNQGTSSNDHVSVALIIDATGSMSSNDPNGLRKEAAKAFVDATQIGDKVAIVAFNTTAYHFQPLLTIQSQADRDTLKAAIEQIGDWGNTDLNVGLNGGFSELLSDTSANRKAAIFLTDGLPTYPYDPQSHLQYQAQGWPVYTIGLSEDADEQLLGLIAAETGGTYTQLANPNDLQAIYFELSAQIAGGNILLEDEFILTAGSVQEVSTSLTPYQAQATFFVSWDGGDVSASLVSPGGRQIDDTTNSPDVYYARGLTYEIYTVQFPETGEWTMNVTGQSLPIGGSEVNIRVASEGPRYVYLPTVLNQFDGAPQPPPYQPYNPNPYDNATNQPVNVLLSWAGGDPANDPVTYDVYFGYSAEGLMRVSTDQSGTTYQLDSLAEDTTYYWRIVSRDNFGATQAGPVWVFTTGSLGRLSFGANIGNNMEIYVMDADGGGQTNLTQNIAFDWGPNWSPDGNRLAFSSDRDGNQEIYIMNADGSGLTRLTNSVHFDFGPAWSPDGNQIAFKSFRGTTEIHLMDTDGSGLTLLVGDAGGDWRISWAPDGNRLAFSSTKDGNDEIYIINVDGSNLTRVTNHPAVDNDVTWSPDGQQLAFVSLRDGNAEIYRMNTDGSDLTRLTFNGAADTLPDWSPDGSRIVFTSYRDGYGAIYIMNVDGSAQTRITTPFDSSYAVWQPQ